MLEVTDLSYVYPDGDVALRSVSLRIAAGEAVAIMGGNGAGKTTLVKHFNGLLLPGSGRVLVDGMDTRRTGVNELARKVGLVFQNPYQQLFAPTVRAEIELGLEELPAVARAARVKETLRTFHLTELAGRHPLSLSEGQKKRLALAAVLAMQPELLVLDEPTLGQDGREKQALAETLAAVQRRGGAVALVTHDIDFACACCQRLVLLAHGRVIADAPAEQALRQPALLRRAGLLPPQLIELAMLLNVPVGDGYPPCQGAAQALRAAVESGMVAQAGAPVFTAAHVREPAPAAKPVGEAAPVQQGLLQALDPRAKLAAATVLFVALLVSSRPEALLLTAALLAVGAAGGGLLRPLTRALISLLPVVALVAGMDVIYFGAQHGLHVGLRFLLTVSLFIVFFLATSLDELSAALTSWRLPYPMVFALVSGARFAPTVAVEANEIMDAYRARGVDGGRGPLAWLRRYSRILVPLVAASIRRSLRLGEAMEMRGFGKSPRPTVLHDLAWRRRDTLLVAAALAAAAVAVRLSI